MRRLPSLTLSLYLVLLLTVMVSEHKTASAGNTSKTGVKLVKNQDYVEAATPSLYWQLYKSLAAYRMAIREEEREGFRYDWIVRARFDTAWARPLPPLHLFSREMVWFGSQFW